jgi:polygalacturonase
MSIRTHIILLALAIASYNNLSAQNKGERYSWDHLPQAKLPTFKTDTFNILQYGAKADGMSLNTEGINRAISACSNKGGGVVLVPAGIWQTGPIVMKSNVNLHISRSALLQFTKDKSQYKLKEGVFEGHKAIRNESPILGTNLKNIAITGDGTVDGHGDVWRAMGKDRVTDTQWKQMIGSGGQLSSDGRMWYPSNGYAIAAQTPGIGSIDPKKRLEDYRQVKDFFRPNLLVLNHCKRVLLQNTTFQNSAAWCLHTIACEDLTFDGVRVRNEENAQNGDGMDIESCSNVVVQNCTLDCGDDGICIKSGKDEEGRKFGKPTQYVVVRNNVVYKAHGGFVIGSEMSGGAHDIFVENCTFIGTDNGLRFKTVRGRGGIVENIFIRNIAMRDIGHDAILFDMYYFTKAPTLAQTNGKIELPPVNDGTPRFRKFYISNLICDGADRAMLIRGLPEMSITDIQLDNVTIRSKKGADIIEAQNIILNKVTLQCEDARQVIYLENSHNISFDQVRSKDPAELFFSLNGDRIKQISVSRSNLSSAKKQADFNYGANQSAIIFTN